MAELKTKPTEQAVESFIDKSQDEQVRDDCYTLIAMMERATGCKAKMWGTAIIGFDTYHYRYESGREGDMCLVGFSPRKANISLYVMLGAIQAESLLKKLGKYKSAKGCLYIKKLSDVDPAVLQKIIEKCVTVMRKLHKKK